MSTITFPQPPIMTAETIGPAMENARAAFMTSTQEMLKKAIESNYTNMTFVCELLYQELEAGSRELAIYRELFFFVNRDSLTTAKWQDIVHRLEVIRKEKMTKAEEARKHLQ